MPLAASKHRFPGQSVADAIVATDLMPLAASKQ